MAKLPRVTAKVFGGSAPLSEIGQFGSAKAGTPNNTQDVATIQALSAYDNGWGSAVVTSKNFPPMEEVTGVLKTISYQTCYLLQEGVPEYDINTEYSNTSIVKSTSGSNLSFYLSLQNGNVGHALSDTDYWVKATDPAIDGPWINSTSANINLTTVTNTGTYNIDLSGILPNDGNNYECLFRYSISRQDGNDYDTTYRIKSSDDTKTWFEDYVEGDPDRSTNIRRKAGQLVAIVGSSRKLKLEITQVNLSASSLDLIMYRRCGA